MSNRAKEIVRGFYRSDILKDKLVLETLILLNSLLKLKERTMILELR